VSWPGVDWEEVRKGMLTMASVRLRPLGGNPRLISFFGHTSNPTGGCFFWLLVSAFGAARCMPFPRGW